MALSSLEQLETNFQAWKLAFMDSLWPFLAHTSVFRPFVSQKKLIYEIMYPKVFYMSLKSVWNNVFSLYTVLLLCFLHRVAKVMWSEAVPIIMQIAVISIVETSSICLGNATIDYLHEKRCWIGSLCMSLCTFLSFCWTICPGLLMFRIRIE